MLENGQVVLDLHDRTGAASVDSVILEAQLGGPDSDSVQEWAVVHDRHKRHVNMRPATQTQGRERPVLAAT